MVGAASIINRGGTVDLGVPHQRAGRRDVSDLAGGSDPGLACRHPAHQARLASGRQQADVIETDENPAAIRRDGDPLRGRHRARPAVTLKNVAQSAGITFVLDNSPTPEKHLIESVPGGVAAFDYNGDGRIDLFFTNGAASPTLEKSSEKYWNPVVSHDGGTGSGAGGGMRFTDVTKDAGLAGAGYRWARPPRTTTTTAIPTCSSPASACVSSIAITAGSSAQRQFGLIANANSGSGEWSVGGGWFDYDNDGDLDLFVVNYVKWSAAQNRFCGDAARKIRVYCHPRHFEGLPNRLGRNRCNGSFEDVSPWHRALRVMWARG